MGSTGKSLEATHVDITEGREATGLEARLGNFRELKGKSENIRERTFSPIGECLAAVLVPCGLCQLDPSWERSKLAWPFAWPES